MHMLQVVYTTNVVIVDISNPANPVVLLEIGESGISDLNFRTESVDAFQGRMRMLQERVHDNLAIIDIGGLEVSNMEAGQIKTDNLEVQQKAQFDQDIFVHGGLNVGHNALDRRKPSNYWQRQFLHTDCPYAYGPNRSQWLRRARHHHTKRHTLTRRTERTNRLAL